LADSGLAGPSGDTGPLGLARAKGNGDTVLSPSPNNRWGVFVTGNGEWANLGNTSNARGYDLINAGVTLGIDFKATDHFAIGLGLGYDDTTVDLTRSGRATVSGGKLAVYATGFTEGGFYTDCLVQGGYNSYDTRRSALEGDARSGTNGGQIIALVGTGYDFKAGGVTFGPTATFKYIDVGVNSFTEKGSLAPLHYPSQHQESITTAIGAKASCERKIGKATLRPELRVRWQHEYSDNTVAVDSGFANGAGPEFTVHGPSIGRDSLLVGAGFSILWTDRFSTNLYYDGELLRTNYQTSNVTGSFRLSF
jgi:outer membrane autotransporter protein